MPRISKVYWPKFDLRYGYLFDIRSEDELYDYWRACRKGQMIEGWNDYMQSSERQNASGQGPGKHHCTTDNGAMLALLRCRCFHLKVEHVSNLLSFDCRASARQTFEWSGYSLSDSGVHRCARFVSCFRLRGLRSSTSD